MLVLVDAEELEGERRLWTTEESGETSRREKERNVEGLLSTIGIYGEQKRELGQTQRKQEQL